MASRKSQTPALHPQQPEPGGPLLSEAVDHYEREQWAAGRWKAEKAGRAAMAELRRFLEYTGDRPVGEVSREDVRGFRDYRGETLRASTLNIKVMSRLVSFFNHCRGEGWVTNLPTNGLRVRDPIPNRDKRRTFTTDGTLDAAIDLDENGDPIIVGFTYTGTQPDGTLAIGVDRTCLDWTDRLGAATHGEIVSTSGTWTEFTATNCRQQRSLYCFGPVQVGGTLAARVTVTATEVDGDVVFAGSGTLNLGAWTNPTTDIAGADVQADDRLRIGPPVLTATDIWQTAPASFTGPSTIGTGTFTVIGDVGSGDFFGLTFVEDGEKLWVPGGYNSLHPLDGSTTFEFETFESLGIDVGTYVWTWGTGQPGESFTLQVPEPSAALAMGVSLATLGAIARSRRRADGAGTRPTLRRWRGRGVIPGDRKRKGIETTPLACATLALRRQRHGLTFL